MTKILFTTFLLFFSAVSAQAAEIIVAAASDLGFAVKEIISTFEPQTGNKIRLSLGRPVPLPRRFLMERHLMSFCLRILRTLRNWKGRVWPNPARFSFMPSGALWFGSRKARR